MNQQSIIERLRTQFEKFIEKRSLAESAETIELRRKLFDAFELRGFPTQKDEEWKYANMNQFLEDEMYLLTDNEGTISPKGQIKALVEEMGDLTLVFVNGFYNDELSRICGGCIEVDTAGFALFDVEKTDDSFTMLQKAFATEEIKIILQGAVVEHPVKLLFCSFAAGLPLIVQPRVRVISPENGEATIIEEYRHFGEQKCLTNLELYMHLDTNSDIKHYRNQNFSLNSSNVHNIKITLQKESKYHVATFIQGDGFVRNTHQVELAGEAAEASLYGSYALTQNAFADNHTSMLHHASHTVSRQIYKGTLDDKSHGVFNGKVIVGKDLIDINSDQSNKTMFLSEHARMDTKPELQIFSDDVKCSHGAALGHLDEETLFFMRARGIGEQKSKYMLSIGFVNEILQRIDNDRLRETLSTEIRRKFLLE